MEWNKTMIRAWVWLNEDDALPKELAHPCKAGVDPDSWKTPYAFFALDPTYCPSNHFNGLQMVFNIDFCGSWTEQQFSACAPTNSSCPDYVQENGNMFKEAYWLINSVLVYQRGQNILA